MYGSGAGALDDLEADVDHPGALLAALGPLDVLVHNADPQRQYRGAHSPVAMAEDQQLLEALRLISYDSISVSSAQ